MKKELKVLILALVVMMVLGVGTTAFAADIPTSQNAVISPEELKDITVNNGGVTKTLVNNESDTTLILTIEPADGMMQPMDLPWINWGYVKYNTWYNIGCTIIRTSTGETVGSFHQHQYIGYDGALPGFYFGDRGNLSSFPSAGWANESVYNVEPPGATYFFRIHAYYKNIANPSLVIGDDVRFEIDAGTGLVRFL